VGEEVECYNYDTWGVCLPEGDFPATVGLYVCMCLCVYVWVGVCMCVFVVCVCVCVFVCERESV